MPRRQNSCIPVLTFFAHSHFCEIPWGLGFEIYVRDDHSTITYSKHSQSKLYPQSFYAKRKRRTYNQAWELRVFVRSGMPPQNGSYYNHRIIISP